jgi:hypothetical protein
VKESFDVEFEISPDGQYVTEVSGEMNRFKAVLKEQVDRNGVRNIKVATKPVGVVSWDREVSTSAQQEIKLKLKTSLEGEIVLPVGGGGRGGPEGGTKVMVQFYGSIFRKYQEDGVIKNGWEVGFQISIPLPEPQAVKRGPNPPPGPRLPDKKPGWFQ